MFRLHKQDLPQPKGLVRLRNLPKRGAPGRIGIGAPKGNAVRKMELIEMVKNYVIPAVVVTLALMPVRAVLADHHEAPAEPPHAALVDGEGKEAGTVVLEQTPGGVLISVAAEGLPPGEHGFHIHEKGLCDVAEGFKTAGGHFNPRGREHGLKSAGGAHAGDMPNQFVAGDGTLRAVVLNPAVTLETGIDSLADADGSALIIHAGSDDYATQPTGAAGGRLACAVISPPAAM